MAKVIGGVAAANVNVLSGTFLQQLFAPARLQLMCCDVGAAASGSDTVELKSGSVELVTGVIVPPQGAAGAEKAAAGPLGIFTVFDGVAPPGVMSLEFAAASRWAVALKDFGGSPDGRSVGGSINNGGTNVLESTFLRQIDRDTHIRVMASVSGADKGDNSAQVSVELKSSSVELITGVPVSGSPSAGGGPGPQIIIGGVPWNTVFDGIAPQGQLILTFPGIGTNGGNVLWRVERVR